MDDSRNGGIQHERGGQQYVEVQMGENASIEDGQQYIVLVNDMTEMLYNMELPLSADSCIYRIPYDLRKLNEEYYTPKAVSIGLFHRGNRRLQTMEKEKVRCLNSFLKRVGLNLGDLVSTIMPLEQRIRGYYGEAIELNSNDFVKMILLDGCFILEMFWEYFRPGWTREFPPCLVNSLLKDFILLENQIPFFIVERLYVLELPNFRNRCPLMQLAFYFFSRFNDQKFDPLPNMKIKHFTDLLRIFLLPPPGRLQCVRRDELVSHLYSATQLHEAGIKFKVSPSKCLLDLKFANGVSEIPSAHLDDRSESLIRNLMAFEQCHLFEEAYITDYYFILDFLINTSHDVDLLCDKGIMVNYLGDSSAAASVINNLNKGIVWMDMSSDYYLICKELNEFYDNPWHSRKATLCREYFSSPWRAASTVAAVIFLVLTIIQTVCSIIQVVPKHM